MVQNPVVWPVALLKFLVLHSQLIFFENIK